MNTLFNYWHIIILSIVLTLFLISVYFAFKQEKKIIIPMIISSALIAILISGFSIIVVDKYTKIVKLYKLKNKRLLSIEKIIYTGVIKNEGNHKIGKVVIEIKLVNKGHATGNVKAGAFYSPSSFLDFFSGGSGKISKPQQVTKEFVIATNLKPGGVKSFRVYFNYPPYFRNTSQFTKLYAH